MTEIRTAAEIKRLPRGTVVRSSAGVVYVRWGMDSTAWHGTHGGSADDTFLAAERAPLTVLYRPDLPDQATLHERVQAALAIHGRNTDPTRHWEPCAEHILTIENVKRLGGFNSHLVAMEACSECTYTPEYHCANDAHVSCGHDAYPCATARALGVEDGEQ